MPEIIDAQTAASMVKENDRIMVGGFLAVGSPDNMIDALIEKGTKNLHMIVICTDYVDRGNGKLITSRQVKSLQVSHIGTNKNTQQQFTEGSLKIEFNPQGTLSERIRIGGAGIGGFLSPVGLGTILENEKQVVEVDGQKFFLERPIKADFAFIRAKKADKFGNLVYSKTGRNSNPLMAPAAKITIVEVDEIVENGQLDPEAIVTPGIYIDYIVKHKE